MQNIKRSMQNIQESPDVFFQNSMSSLEVVKCGIIKVCAIMPSYHFKKCMLDKDSSTI